MRRHKAFTLLEIIVVLVIIGILATLVGVRLTDTLAEARKTRIEADLAILMTAADQYAQRYPEGACQDQETLLEAGVLATGIESPVGHYTYTVAIGDGAVTVALKRGDEVYEQEDFRAEQTSRLYPT